MTKYAHTDNDGHVVGWYDTDLHPYVLPENAVEISEADWVNRMRDPSRWKIVTGRLTFVDAQKSAASDVRNG
jgi:hypothetical protein